MFVSIVFPTGPLQEQQFSEFSDMVSIMSDSFIDLKVQCTISIVFTAHKILSLLHLLLWH